MSSKISLRRKKIVNLTCKTLVGKKIKVVDSSNSNLIGMQGVVIFETQNLFFLKEGSHFKKIIKKEIIFEVQVNNEIYLINGQALKNDLILRIKKLKI